MKLVVHELVAKERKSFWHCTSRVQLLRQGDVDADLTSPIVMSFHVQATDLGEGLAALGRMMQEWESNERARRGERTGT